MSIIFTESFQSYATDTSSTLVVSDLLARWGATNASFVAGSIKAPTTPRYTGQKCFGQVGGFLRFAPFTQGPANQAAICGFAFYMPTLPAADVVIATHDVGGNTNHQANLVLKSSAAGGGLASTLVLLAGGTTTRLADDAFNRFALSAATWYYIEWRFCTKTSVLLNDVQVNVNGAKYVSVTTGTSTVHFSTNTASGFGVGGGNDTVALAASTVEMQFADLYYKREDGVGVQGFLGDCRVECLRPTANGSTITWTPLNGTPNTNVANVAGSFPSNTSSPCNQVTPGVGSADTFLLNGLASTPLTIWAVGGVAAVVATDGSTTHSLANRYRIGSTNYTGAAGVIENTVSQPHIGSIVTISTGYDEVSPATGAAWTGAAVNAMEAGYILAV